MSRKPPPSLRRDFEIVRFGRKRNDPHADLKAPNWPDVLEDPAKLSPDIRRRLDAENDYFNDAAKNFAGFTASAAESMKKRLQSREASVPEREGDFEYWYEYKEAANYPLYMRRHVTSGKTDLLIDVEKESEGLAFFDVAGLYPSPDQKIVAYVADCEGAGNFNVIFRDTASGQDLPDMLLYTKCDIAWSKDSTAVYYTECDDKSIAKRVKRHVLGTEIDDDIVIYEEQNADRNITLRQSQSGDYIFIESKEGASVTVETRFLNKNTPSPPQLIAPYEQGVDYHAEHRGDHFYIRTNADGAVNGKIVRAPVAAPGRENWKDVVPHNPQTPILHMITLKDYMVREELQDASPRIVVSDYNGHEYAASLTAEPCHLYLYPGQAFDTAKLTVEYQTLANPGETYEVDLATGHKKLTDKVRLPDGHDPADYVIERKFVPARGGSADIPVTILRHKSVKADGSAPLYLYGYGAYGGGVPADFSNEAVALAERGVIFAIAHVRGGNERGPAWHADGRADRKMNSFSDFIDVAESLTDQGYGQKGKIVIEGRSAGGLLMGAVLNMRPELFTGAIVGEAFLDVMNTMSDPSLPWVDEEKAEWGDPDKEKSFHYMHGYSPYDNIRKDAAYPAILATTAISDSCVMYWEPAKWIARLRDEAKGGPFYLKVNTSAGHDGASARLEKINEMAVEIGFALAQFSKCGYDVSLRNNKPRTPKPPGPSQS